MVMAWALYIAMAVLLMAMFERYLAPYLRPYGQSVLMLRTLLAILLFTPGWVLDAEQFYLVPATTAVLFNVLAQKPMAVLQACLPLLLTSTLVFAGLFWWQRRQMPADMT